MNRVNNPEAGGELNQAGLTESDLDGATENLETIRLLLNDIRKYPLLNAEQEVHHSKRIEAGLYAERLLAEGKTPSGETIDGQLKKDLLTLVQEGEMSKQTMISSNMALVVNLARRYRGRGMEFLDLIQEGSTGLIRAVEKFDYLKGYKFSTYATWWIRQAITRGMAQQSRPIRIPVHAHEELNGLRRLEKEYYDEFGEYPTDAEAADMLDSTEDRIKWLRFMRRDILSLDSTSGDGTDLTLGSLVKDPAAEQAFEQIDGNDEQARIEDLLVYLEPLTANCIRLRYGLLDGREWRTDEIAKELGISRPTVNRHLKLGLAGMQNMVQRAA